MKEDAVTCTPTAAEKSGVVVSVSTPIRGKAEAALAPRTVPNAGSRKLVTNMPRRLSIVTSFPAKQIVSPVDSRTSSTVNFGIKASPALETPKAPTTARQEYGPAQLASMTAFTTGEWQYPATLPRAAVPIQGGRSEDTPSRAGAQTCGRMVNGLARSMASLNLIEQSPSPRKGNFLRLTPESDVC